MTILEVGINKTYKSISEAIFAAVDGDENLVNSIIGKCSFTNIIFVEQKAADFKDYEKILGGEKLAEKLK